MIIDRVRAIVESTYCDTCTIIESKKTKEKGVASFSDDIIVENEKCKISFESKPSTSESDTLARVIQSIRLFLAPEIIVNPGAKINVTHMGVVTEYKSSGKSGMYNTHQEIDLEIWKDKA